jgi:SAM-dependent MidA family methyltransferase
MGSDTIPRLLRGEIESAGSVSFERFMEVALYTPEAGYYCRERDPFGKDGDFFTAEQVQPVFGLLIAQALREFRATMGDPPSFRVVELGAGRREMAEQLSAFDYTGIETGDALPSSITGVVFANEFFDALPVYVALRRANQFRQMRVGLKDGRLAFIEGEAVEGCVQHYLLRYHRNAPEGSIVEVNMRALDWIRRLAAAVDRGYAVIIDYGYTAREWIRHRQGTLMSYSRHRASDDVLSTPGECDITAHVAWTPLEETAVEAGWTVERFETLAAFLLRAGAKDNFESAIADRNEREALRRRLQLKTLLFGMGETFRVLLLRKDA